MSVDASFLQNLWLFAAIMSGAFIICLACLLAVLARSRQERRERQHKLQDSLNRSRSVLRGQVSESFAPLLPGFPFNHKDARFLGQPVDYLVFDGLSDGDGRQAIDIVLVEIKTGNSGLSPRELAIRTAVQEGRVSWMTLRMDAQGRLNQDPERDF